MMCRTTLWLLVGLSACVLVTSSDPAFCKGKSDGLQGDPADCEAFYNCFVQRTYWFKCAPGTFFSNKIKNCDWKRNVNCAGRGLPRSQTTESGGGVEFCDGKVAGIYPDPESCQKFYQCGSGKTFPRSCDDGLLFNRVSETCDWPANVDCSIQAKTTAAPEKATTVAPEKVTTVVPEKVTTGATEKVTPEPEKVTTQAPAKVTTVVPAKVTTVVPEKVTTVVPEKVTTQAPEKVTPEPEKVTTVAPQEVTTAAPKVTKEPSTSSPSKNSGCQRVVCYFTNWAQYRNGNAKQKPEDLDANMCTHIVYAFAKMNGNVLAPFEWNDDDEDWSMGNYRRVTNLKKINPNLKVLLAVGGWNMGSPPFTGMVAAQNTRKEFIDHSIKYLRDRGFDGLDLDWEYPANRGSPAEDKAHFSDLLRETRAAYIKDAADTGLPRLLLTAAVAAGAGVVETAYDVPVLNSELDFINLMSYDLHGGWDSITGHNSPLYAGSWESGADAQLNVHWAANNWVRQGASRKNLVIGVPLYSRTFSLSSAANSAVGAPAKGAGNAGQSTREKGFLAYYEICDMIKSGATKGFIKEQRVPYIVWGDQWAGYDDPSSLREKVNYIRDQGYGGVMTWDLSLDDIRGTSCGQGTYPLMAAINNACGR